MQRQKCFSWEVKWKQEYAEQTPSFFCLPRVRKVGCCPPPPPPLTLLLCNNSGLNYLWSSLQDIGCSDAYNPKAVFHPLEYPWRKQMAVKPRNIGCRTEHVSGSLPLPIWQTATSFHAVPATFLRHDVKVWVNGFRCIEHLGTRAAFNSDKLAICATSGPLIDLNNTICMFQYYSTHGKLQGTVKADQNGKLVINGAYIKWVMMGPNIFWIWLLHELWENWGSLEG